MNLPFPGNSGSRVTVQHAVMEVALVDVTIFEGNLAPAVESLAVNLVGLVEDREVGVPISVDDFGQIEGDDQVARIFFELHLTGAWIVFIKIKNAWWTPQGKEQRAAERGAGSEHS